MHPLDTASAAVGTSLLEDFSLEMTGKDVPELEAADGTLPRGTRVNVTFLGNEDTRMRLDAARAVKRLGLLPVPHVSARRLTSRTDFEQFLAGLRDDGTATHVFTVAGDPALPQGPYDSALALIDSGLLQEHGVRHVGIAGYPEGHPALTDDTLRSALRDKVASLTAHGLSGHITTQFGFDPDPVLGWLEHVRDQGITLPVRIGVPGPRASAACSPTPPASASARAPPSRRSTGCPSPTSWAPPAPTPSCAPWPNGTTRPATAR